MLELGSLKPSSWMDGLVLIAIGSQELRTSKPSVVLGVKDSAVVFVSGSGIF